MAEPPIFEAFQSQAVMKRTFTKLIMSWMNARGPSCGMDLRLLASENLRGPFRRFTCIFFGSGVL